MKMIKVGNNKRIQSVSEKAILLEIGRTFDGQVITTWYPKSVVRVKNTRAGYDIFAPAWVNYQRNCIIGSYEVPEFTPGMYPFMDDMAGYDPMPF